MKIISCGLILTDMHKLLLCHATGQHWDLPKGQMEDGELPIDTCIREVREETGLSIECQRDDLVDLGVFSYNKKKDLHLFLYRVATNELPLISKMRCTSYFKAFDKEVLEVDKFEYVSWEDIQVYATVNMFSVLSKVKEII